MEAKLVYTIADLEREFAGVTKEYNFRNSGITRAKVEVKFKNQYKRHQDNSLEIIKKVLNFGVDKTKLHVSRLSNNSNMIQISERYDGTFRIYMAYREGVKITNTLFKYTYVKITEDDEDLTYFETTLVPI